jgi:hypothetical protein
LITITVMAFKTVRRSLSLIADRDKFAVLIFQQAGHNQHVN